MKVNKIVFLDIDGVLNSQDWAEKFHDLMKAGAKPQGINDLCDPAATNKLIEMLKETGAYIVLSSSWRSNNVENTRQEFSEFRHTPFHKLVPYIIGVTPRFYERLWRGREIQYWLDWIDTGQLLQKHLILPSVELDKNIKYVIIDDDNDMLENQNFVRTDWMHGLTEVEIELAKKYLE